MRPTKFDPAYVDAVCKLTRLGATDTEIADFFDVSERTLNTWKQKHPEFLQALKRGKWEADARVADALFRRATGYSHPDVDVRTVSLGNNRGSEIVQTPITKHHPPDTTACIFWLKNRQRNKWNESSSEPGATTPSLPSPEVLKELHEAMEASRARFAQKLAERRAMGFTGD